MSYSLDPEQDLNSIGPDLVQNVSKQKIKVTASNERVKNLAIHLVFSPCPISIQKDYLIEMVLLSTHYICFG